MDNFEFKKPKVVAEIGCNHMGDMEVAKEMINVAKTFCKTDIVKFQKRDVFFWKKIKYEIYEKPHPNSHNSFGDTYFKHRQFLEFNIFQHKELKLYCENIDVKYSCSVWDVTSAKEIAGLEPFMIKIPSASNNNFDLINWLCDNYKGEIHLSTGMTRKSEIKDIINFFINKKRNGDLVLYHCVSGYPIKFKDSFILEINKFKNNYKNIIKGVGYSGHHLGIAIDIAAYVLGANIIERHFTLDRTWKGTDHAASLEPDGLRKLKRDLMATYESLKFKDIEMLDFEKEQYEKLKYQPEK